MSSIFNSARGPKNYTSGQIKVDMSNDISILQPRLYPLSTIIRKMATRPATNYRFDWLDDALMARWVTAAAALVSATTITVGTNEGAVIAVGDLLKVIATGEVMRVTAVAGDSITVVRGYGTTAATAIPAGAKVTVMGNAMAQGTGSGAEKYMNTVPFYNYTRFGCVA
jgi:hypothetical protein